MNERGEIGMRPEAEGRRETVEAYKSDFDELYRLDEQEKLLLDEVVTNADRYSLEEYKTVLDQIKGLRQRREELSKKLDQEFEALEKAA